MALTFELETLGPALVVDAEGRVEQCNAGGEAWRGLERMGLSLRAGQSRWVERAGADGTPTRALLSALPRPGGGALLLFTEVIPHPRLGAEAMRALLDGIPAMIGYWDAAMRNRFANRAYREWFGMTPEAIEGRHIRDLLGDEIYAKNLPYMQAALRGELQAFERVIPKPDGTAVRHASALYVPDIDRGSVLGFSVLVFDITQLKNAEFALQAARAELEERVAQRTHALQQANAELERSNRELAEFANVTSHDLQEPLRTLTTYCELLREHYAGQQDARGERYLGHVIEAGRRMQALIAAVLEVSQVGGAVRPFERFDVGEAARAAIAALRARIEETDATVVVEPMPCVLGDPIAISAVFQNLLANAIKFAGEAPPRVTIAARELGELVELTVSDNGVGLDMEFAGRIFGMFQRAHGSRYEGSGIGLAIVKKIVERHGGEVGIRSAPGRGATVWFTLRRVVP